MQARLKFIQIIGSIVFVLALPGCSDSSDRSVGIEVPEYLPIANPTVSLPPEEGAINLFSLNFDLSTVGYQQEEYFLAGTASAFSNLNELGEDGFWSVEPGAAAEYKTRIVVYRPSDPADFNGRVLVEWLNVTAGFETPPSWGTGHLEMRRSGSVGEPMK